MDLIERAAKEAKEKALAKAQEKARELAQIKAQEEADKLASQGAADGPDAAVSAADDKASKFKGLSRRKKPAEAASVETLDAPEVSEPTAAEEPAVPRVRGIGGRKRSLNDPVESELTKGLRSLGGKAKSSQQSKEEELAKKGLRGLGRKKPEQPSAEPTVTQPILKPDPTDMARTAALAQTSRAIGKKPLDADKAKTLSNFEDALVRRAEKEGTAFKPPISRLLKEKQAEVTQSSEHAGPILPALEGTNLHPADDKARAHSKYSEIDLTLLRERGFITPDMPTNMMAEEFRIIKRTLLLNAFGAGDQKIDKGNVIMVTSSNPNEGKTFCAINLALSIATEQDTTILLIDADFNKPEVLNRLGMRGGKGFMDVVADESLTLGDCLLRTNVDNLVVMPAGRQHNRTTELLASERMKNLVNELSTRYPDRLIIFDAPPSLASSVPSVLSLYVGQTVYVIAAEETSEMMIKEGLTLINKCKNINLLLNKTRMGSSNKKFATYYGYGRR